MIYWLSIRSGKKSACAKAFGVQFWKRQNGCGLAEGRFAFSKVEVRGIEPLSKHILQKFSTCLFRH